MRPEHHDADGRRNEQQPEMLAEGARHFIERSVNVSAQREEAEQQNEADDGAGNQRQKEMRDELAQPLKKQDLYEAGNHEARAILAGFYPGPLDRSMKRTFITRLTRASTAARRARFGLLRWNTARALFLAALCFFAVNGNAAEGVKRFPGDALR